MQQLPEGEPIDFNIVKEDWNEYRLSDGTVLKVKLILTGVLRLKNQYDPIGNPVYVIASQNAVRVVSVPEELRYRPSSKTPTV